MTYELNALSPTPAGERPQDGRGGAAEFDVDGLGAIGFESACPALLASLWLGAAADGGAAVEPA